MQRKASSAPTAVRASGAEPARPRVSKTPQSQEVVLDPTSLRRQIVSGEEEEAEQVINDAVRSGRDDAVVHELLAFSAFRRGDDVAASVSLDRSVERDREFLPARVLGIKLYSRMGDTDRSVEHAHAALALAPANPEALFAAGKIFTKVGDHAQAAELMSRMGKVRPHDLEARRRAISAFEKAGLLDRGLEEACAACADNPGAIGLHLQHCELAVRSSSASALRRAILPLAEIDPGEAFKWLSDLVLAGFFSEADWLVRRAAQAGFTVDPNLADSLGRFLEGQVGRAEANEDFLAALAALRLASVLHPARDVTERIGTTGKAIQRQVQIAFKAGEVDRAREMCARLSELWPTPQALSLAASLAQASGDPDTTATAYVELALHSDGTVREEAVARALREMRRMPSPIDAMELLNRLDASLNDRSLLNVLAEPLPGKAYRQAVRFLDDGDFATAQRGLSEMLRWNADDPQASGLARKLAKRASVELREARQAEDVERAVVAADRLVALEPERVDALKYLALYHLKAGRYERACELFEQLRVLQPDVSSHLYHLGRVYRSLGRFDEGIATLIQLLEIEPDNVKGKELLNEILYRHAS